MLYIRRVKALIIRNNRSIAILRISPQFLAKSWLIKSISALVSRSALIESGPAVILIIIKIYNLLRVLIKEEAKKSIEISSLIINFLI